MSERRARIFGSFVRSHQRRCAMRESLTELATLWRNLGIAGALCAAYSTGWTAAHRQEVGARPPVHWWPGCGRVAG